VPTIIPDEAGRLDVHRIIYEELCEGIVKSDSKRRYVAEVERLRGSPERHRTGDELSTRNRFPGRVVSVEVDGVMALVEIEAGPHRVTAAITRDSVEELGLVEGVEATALVKATSVMIQRR
jgi:molybdopterin-binding protein